MNDNDGVTHQMLVRSREAFAQSVNDFSEVGAARQTFARLQTRIPKIEQLAAAFGVGRSGAKQGTQTINDAREAILADLFAIREAAKVLGVEEKFPYPPRKNDEQLLQLAGVYANNDLAADLAELQSAFAERMNAVGDHIAARQELDDELAGGLEDVRDLTSFMKVQYANNPGKLAEWAAATHIERAPRRAKPKPPDSAGSPTPPAPPG